MALGHIFQIEQFDLRSLSSRTEDLIALHSDLTHHLDRFGDIFSGIRNLLDVARPHAGSIIGSSVDPNLDS